MTVSSLPIYTALKVKHCLHYSLCEIVMICNTLLVVYLHSEEKKIDIENYQNIMNGLGVSI